MESTFDFSAILDEARTGYGAAGRPDRCPDMAMLIDLACDDLDPAAERETVDHVDRCLDCGLTLLKIEADCHLWELEMAASPDEALFNALGKRGRKAVRKMMGGGEAVSASVSAVVSAVKESAAAWASKLWVPTWAGEAITALDLPEQHQHFDMGEGEYVDLSCSWEGGQTGQARRIRLSWSANIFSPGKIWVHFVDPKSGSILGKHCLGEILEGVVQLESGGLNFDPSTQKWAIQIVIEP